MAYISTQKVAEFRKQIKDAFPDWKISVVTQRYTAVRVTILEAPVDLISMYKTNVLKTKEESIGVNVHYIKEHFSEPAATLLLKIKDICMAGNYNNSRIELDYFDVGWYLYMDIGSHEKPFKYIDPSELRDKKITKVLGKKSSNTKVEKSKKEIELLDYSDKSFIVIGDTYDIKDKLMECSGRYNRFLKNPQTGDKVAGWVFSIKSKDKVKELLYATV